MATSKNEHTGDSIQSKTPSEDYRSNYDRIFRKKVEEIKNYPKEHQPFSEEEREIFHEIVRQKMPGYKEEE